MRGARCFIRFRDGCSAFPPMTHFRITMVTSYTAPLFIFTRLQVAAWCHGSTALEYHAAIS